MVRFLHADLYHVGPGMVKKSDGHAVRVLLSPFFLKPGDQSVSSALKPCIMGTFEVPTCYLIPVLTRGVFLPLSWRSILQESRFRGYYNWPPGWIQGTTRKRNRRKYERRKTLILHGHERPEFRPIQVNEL